MVNTNARLKLAEPPPVVEPAPVQAPVWFQAALVSLAVFIGPIVLAVVVGLVYLAAVVCGQTYALFRQNAGG